MHSYLVNDMTKEIETKRQGIDESEVCVCFHLRKAARVITQIYDDAMRPLGYRATQITCLGVIAKSDSPTVKEMAKFMDTDPTTLIRNLRLLEKEELVDIREGKEDRRERRLYLTDKGNALLAEAHPIWKKMQDRITNIVGEDRINVLLQDLGTVLDQVKEE